MVYRNLKPGSQYIARDASRPEVILFSMGFDASRRKNINRGLTKTWTGPDPRTRTKSAKNSRGHMGAHGHHGHWV